MIANRKDERFTVLLIRGTRDKLRIVAAKNKMSPSGFVRNLIEEEISKEDEKND